MFFHLKSFHQKTIKNEETFNPISKLSPILNASFSLSKHRILLLAQLIIAICSINTVNLKKIANIIDGKTLPDSNYRKIQRFFAETAFCYDEISRYIVSLFFNDKVCWYLSLDRTNWQYGKTNINILVLGICYKGRAIPVCWKMLDKKGNSNTAERMELLSRFIRLFGKQRIKALLADREFIGADWFDWLNQEKIPFNIRIKNNSIATNSRGLSIDIDGLFYHLKVGQQRSLKGKRILWGQEVYLSGLRMKTGELLIVATNENMDDAIEIYAKRWEIETLFECLKGRGFNFESTRLTDPERVNKMVAVLAIAYCWAHKTGEWRLAQGQRLKIKKHGRWEKSLFRHGLDLLQRLFCCDNICLKTLNRCVKLMVPREISTPKIQLLFC